MLSVIKWKAWTVRDSDSMEEMYDWAGGSLEAADPIWSGLAISEVLR